MSGKSTVLITDAGTPGISGSAFLLVRERIRNDIIVECHHGAGAFIPVWIDGGLPVNDFSVEDFLSLKRLIAEG